MTRSKREELPLFPCSIRAPLLELKRTSLQHRFETSHVVFGDVGLMLHRQETIGVRQRRWSLLGALMMPLALSF
jgi:hypothetical protein